MIKEISAERLEKKIDNVYRLVVVASERTRQLARGARRLVDTDSKKLTTIALTEINEGKVRPVDDDDPAEE